MILQTKTDTQPFLGRIADGRKGLFTPDALRCGALPRSNAPQSNVMQRMRCERTD